MQEPSLEKPNQSWIQTIVEGEQKRTSLRNVLKTWWSAKLGPDPATCRSLCARFWTGTFPILGWLPNYSIKSDLVGDLVAGITVSILHIPQGLAYAILAGVAPIHGLYLSALSPIIYALMGSSRHLSMGTFAIGSLMLSNTISNMGPLVGVTPLQIVSSECLFTGAIQILMALTSLGYYLSVIFSGQLVSAFCAGSAIQIATSQLDDLIGISYTPRKSTFGKTVLQWGDFLTSIPAANPASVIIASVTLLILLVTKLYVDPWTRPKIHIPIPADFIVVIGGTVLSWLCSFNQNYGVEVIGNIPTGLPIAVVPRMDLLPDLWFDSLIFAIVSFAFSLSPAIMYAKKNSYTVNPNQEMLAYGATNLFVSFLQCFPCASALSRTAVQENSGGRTQLASLITSVVLILVVLFLAPLFYHLPNCILAAVIIVALRPMFLRCIDLVSTARISLSDGTSWLVTFVGVIVLGVDWGLIAGIIFSLVVLVGHLMLPLTATLSRHPLCREVYVDELYNRLLTSNSDRSLDSASCPPKRVQVLRFYSPVVFLNRQILADRVRELLAQGPSSSGESLILIIDLSAAPFVDYDGVVCLTEVFLSHAVGHLRFVTTNPLVISLLHALIQDRKLSDKIDSTLEQVIFPSIDSALTPSGSEPPPVDRNTISTAQLPCIISMQEKRD